MRLLIVDDNEALAEITAKLLWWVDEPERHIEAISLAGDLASAQRLLPQHDTVLCDGQFPRSPDSRFKLEEWDEVFREARRRGARFVLYSASAACVQDAHNGGVPAISKPATIESIYSVLTEHCARSGPQPSPADPAGSEQLHAEDSNETGSSRILPGHRRAGG